MELVIPIMKEEEVRKKILKRVAMPKEGWLDITDGFNLKFDSHLLLSAVTVLLTDLYKTGMRNVDVLATCEASGNVLIVLGGLVALELGIARKEEFYTLTFRKTAEDEKPMFELFRPVRSASHGDRVQNISTRKDFLESKRVLMLDDVLRDGGTARAIKEMVEKTGGIFRGLGVLFRKMWLKDEQLENLKDTPIVSLIEVPSPDPAVFSKIKIE